MTTTRNAGSAVLSSDGRFRYRLARDLTIRNPSLFDPPQGTGTVAFCMLNPSTADAEEDDPTIRRCMGFARSWGYRRLVVVNLYAYRATDPKVMAREKASGRDIIGPDNDSSISMAAAEAQVVVAAWGNLGEIERARAVCKMVGPSKLRCLGISKTGAPLHPLYLPGDLEPMAWRGP